MASYSKSKESRLVNHPSIIENAGMKFLIFDAPSDENIEAYIDMFKQHNVTHVVRVCDPTYSTEPIETAGIAFHDMPFPDGDAPPKAVVDNWLGICKKVFKNSSGSGADNPAIGIHCVAGLGRAPILVTIALIESGLDAVSAVNLIRTKRKGAINRMQLQYLKKYKKSGGCVIL